METKLRSDKIGFSKGNSTVEGIAEIKELVDNGRVRCRVLQSTHYHSRIW